MVGVHEDHPPDPMGLSSHEVLHDHPAHRVADDVESLPLQNVGQPDHVEGECVEAVGVLVAGMIAVAVAAMVGSHRVEAQLREACDLHTEVLLGPRETVNQQKRQPTRARFEHRQVQLADRHAARIETACGVERVARADAGGGHVDTS